MINIPTEIVKIGKIQKKVSNNTSQVFHPETEIAQIVDFPETYNNTGKYLTTDGSNLFWNTVSVGDSLPSQTGNSGKYLTTDGSSVSWATVDALPSQTNNAGKYLTTNGTTASWEELFPGEIKISSVHNPSANATTITLTSSQRPDSNVDKYALSVYRDGIHLIDGIDYTYASNSGVLTFTRAFESTELVSVNFSYLTTDGGSSGGSGDSLPTQTGQSGKFLTTNGTDASWANIPEYTLPVATASTLGGIKVGSGLTITDSVLSADSQIPSQTNNNGKYLTTNGSELSWSSVDALPSQTNNAGKFLTTDGSTASWSDILNEIKLSSIHYPSATDTTIALTQEQAVPSTIGKYTMSVYRDGIYLNPGVDYGYNTSTRTLTFIKPFNRDEVVTVLFTYLSTDTQDTFNLDIEEYEAGNGITFTNNAVTNKTVINAIDQLPSQTNNSGKYLTTNGTSVSWSIDPFSAWDKDYNDLINKPTIPVVPTAVSSFTNDAGYLTSVNWNDVGNKPTFATVATTGDYTDLINTPTIPVVPTNVSAFTNDSGYITGVAWDDITNKPSTFTPAAHNHDGVYATPSDVSTAVANLVNSAPSTLDTLDELANALGDDPNFATTVATQIGSKLDSDSANYVKSLSISGTTITVTKGNDTTSTLTTQDTTYTAGTGIDITNGVISADDQLPTQTGNSGKYLTTNGTSVSWGDVDALPSQTGNSGKYLTTNGTTASWTELGSSTLPTQTGNAGKVLITNGTTASWVSLNSVQEVFNVNSSTTSVTLESIPNNAESKYIAVYHDGLRLVDNIDYTYNSSTKTVSFSRSFLNGDQVVVYIGPIDFGTGDSSESGSIEGLPSQTGNSGKFLTTNGATLSWATVDALPSQTGNSGKFLTTNGTNASWANVTPGETRISSIHYPDEDDLTVTLTIAQVPDSNISDYNMSVYRDGVYLIKDIDYTFNTTTRVITFAHSFESEEVVFVLFTYLSDGVSTNIVTGDSLPSQTGNSGKFLTTNGTTASWATLPSGSGSSEDEVRISSIHYPASGATSITLTSEQNLPGTINKYALSIYRNGIYLNNTLDYTYNNSTGVITFTEAFTADEVIVVNFAYLSSDSGTNSTYLDLAGTQTMTGSIRSNSQEVIHISNVTTTGKVITAYDDNNNLLGKLEFTKDSTGKKFVNIQSVDGNLSSQLSIVTDSTNTNTYITGPSISDVNDNSNKLATTSYVHLANNDRFGIATERVVNLTVDDNNITINPSLGTLFKATLNGNTSVIINAPRSLYTNNGSTIGLHITLTDENAVISWPQNVKWPDDTAPDLGYINIITFMTFDAGVTWYASLYVASSTFPSA